MKGTRGQNVRLFLVEGTAGGIVTAEIGNWTGHAVIAPRRRLADVLRRDEASRTGIYFLLGEVADVADKREVYIGESDDVGRRILQHSKNPDKTFFERFCFFTSKDMNLTKAHCRYLESRLTRIAQSADRAVILNGLDPPAGTLPEADISDMEGYIERIRLLMPVLGYDFLRDVQQVAARQGGAAAEEENAANEILRLTLKDKKTGIEATAIENEGGYIVLEGSMARPDTASSMQTQKGYLALRERLIAEGSLQEDAVGKHLVFRRDMPFSSASAASAVILGRSDNGLLSWKVESTGQTLFDYRNAQTEEAAK